jgi:hypothetical protein
MPKNTGFYQDILFFERIWRNYAVTIDTKKKKGNETLYLEKDGWTSKTIEKIPELSKPISILNLVKYSKQAYYNGNPEYYDLPTSKSKVSF